MVEINKTNYEEQVRALNEAADSYYAGDTSPFSDEEYDSLIEALRKYEVENNIVNPESPTQKVNGGTLDDKVIHVKPMLSLRDVFNINSLNQWLNSKPPQAWCVEEKIDGLSMEFVYKNGVLQRAVTRGNGYKGVDVTHIIKEIPNLPLTISYHSPITLRGEVYMPQSKFQEYTETIGPAANPRNLAVGLVKRKDDVSGAKFLSYFMFNVQDIQCDSDEDFATINKYGATTHSGHLRMLKGLGFQVVYSILANQAAHVSDAIEAIGRRRASLDYNIDGAVVKANNLMYREEAKDDGAVPRWAVAYKYPPKEVETEVLSIEYQLGKTGKLTPVAILQPVEVDGSVISRCTLHNRQRMIDLDYIRPGDLVILYKSGDIIPAIKSARRGPHSLDAFSYPSTCPVCNHTLNGGEVCKNFDCRQKKEVRLHHWASKSGVDFVGISRGTVQLLIDAKKVDKIVDFYKLKPADLLRLPKFGRAKVNKVLMGIQNTLNADFGTVLTGLCIEGLGFSSAYKLTDSFPTWDALLNANIREYQSLLGNVLGERIYMTLHTNYYKQTIEELKEFFPFDKDER